MTRPTHILRPALFGAILLLCMGACSKELMPGLSVEPATTADRSGGGTVPVTVTPIEDIAGGIDTTQLNESAGVVVRFSKGDGEFAFDAAEQDWYRTALLVRDKYYKEFGEGYIAPWKLVPVGESDTVEAVIAEGKANPEDIGFVLKDGTGVPAKESGGKWTLTLPSVGSGEEYPVFAVLKKRNGNLTVGKLNVVSYPTQTRTVTLVPVFERFSDVGAVERELNAIYAPYGVEFTVAENNSMIGVWDWDLDGDGALNLDGSGFFSNETDEMKALRQAYQATGNYDRNGYYLFVMRSAKADTEPEFTAAGDMPRGKQFGYLFSADPGPSLSRLAAHELGHGIFTLTHTFDSNYGGGDSRAQTPNLMDYADGTDLGAFQWSVIAKPAPLTWFDDEEDAMAGKNTINVNKVIKWIIDNKKERSADFKYTDYIDIEIGRYTPNDIKIDVKPDYGSMVYMSPKFKIEINANKPSIFNIYWEYADDREAIRFYTSKYDDFYQFIRSIGYPIEDYLYLFKDDMVKQYEREIVKLENEISKIGDFYGNMPDFVCEAANYDNETLYGHLDIFEHQKYVNVTTEERAIVNIFKSFDGQWLVSKIQNEPHLFERILSRMSSNQENGLTCINLITELAAKYLWKEQDYRDAKFVLWEPLQDDGDLFYLYALTDERFTDATRPQQPRSGASTIGYWVDQIGTYEFSISYAYGSNYVGTGEFQTNTTGELEALSPTLILLNGEVAVYPAIATKYLMKRRNLDLILGETKETLRSAIELIGYYDGVRLIISGLNKGYSAFLKFRTIAQYGDEIGLFVNKTTAEKLDDIAILWKLRYPANTMLEGRGFFEKLMGHYRYSKSSGWSHTGDIASNFRGVDFYKGTVQGANIYAETAVSMKSTTITDVNRWLNSQPIKTNLSFLREGFTEQGLVSNNRIMHIDMAEIHIYMPRANITPSLNNEWMRVLNRIDPKIRFEINALEDFIK